MKQENVKYYEVEKVNSIKELMNNAVCKAGDKVAFKYKKNKEVVDVTYSEFQNITNYLGTALCSISSVNKHIGVIGENSFKWLSVYITVLKSSGVFVPIDKELPKEDIIYILNHSDCEVLFFSKRYEKYIEDIIKNTNVKYFIGFDSNNTEKIINYDEFLEKGKQMYLDGCNEYVNITPDTDKLKMIVYTSGTTGMAKGVMLSEHNLVSCVYYGLQVSAVYDRCLSVLPYHHTYESTGILFALHHHSTICINDNLKSILKNLVLYKPDYICLVPAFAEMFYKKILDNAKKTHKETTLKMLIKLSNILRKFHIDLRKTFFKSIHDVFGGNMRKIVVGGAPLRPELGEFFESIGISLVNGYGITECSPMVSANIDYLNDPSTVGYELPCLEVKFENMTEDKEGEICVKGDTVMLGYYKNESQTQKVLKNGWFNTEDYGKRNEKGQIIITGRKKNLIVLDNGKNVFPEEIENYIMGIDYIQEVIVCGIENENHEQTGLVAKVYLNKEKAESLDNYPTEDSIRKDILKVTQSLPVYKKIQKVEIMEEAFKKTTTNKIKR